jgi:NAD(P)H-dependent FMN reductase
MIFSDKKEDATMNENNTIIAFAGSLRKDSVNKKLLSEAVAIARGLGAHVEVLDLASYPLPFYNADLESAKGMPEEAKKFRRLLIEAKAIMIASPEYNASVSGVLKNQIDWCSRSEEGKPSRDAFKGKKIALMSASPSTYGGSRALADLRPILEDIGGIVLKNQVSLPNAYQAFNPTGKLLIPEKLQELNTLIKELV